MMKWILIAAAIAVIYWIIKSSRKKALDKGAKAKPEQATAATGVLVRDPVCGTYVSKDSDIRVKDNEAVHCFCSYACRDKYIEQHTLKQDNKTE